MKAATTGTTAPPAAPPAGAGEAAAAPSAERWWSRREDIRLTTGLGAFVDDVTRDGQLWLRVVRSPIAHGRIVEIDAADAAEMPGVQAVLTGADLEHPRHIPLRIQNRPELAAYVQPVIAVDVVRYVGEPVAVVVATSPRQAEDAAELVIVDIDPLPAAVDSVAPHEVPVWPEAEDDVLCRFTAQVGNFEEVAATAAHVLTEEFETGRDTGLPLETRGLVAEWAADGRLHLWGPTKFLRFTRRTVADWFGLDEEQVVCHHVDVGGMFGSRGEVYPEDFLVPWAARVTGSPVKWIEDRNEHLVSINHSRGQRHRISIAAAESGELLGMRAEARVDMGAYSRPIGGRVPELTLESLPGPYRWSALDLHCAGVATNKTPVGTMRGPATFDTTFVRERMIDLLAAELGRDPLDLRRQNLITADELPYTQSFGDQMHSSVYDSGDYPLVVDGLLARMDADRINAEVESRRAAGELVGIGTAFFLDHSGLGREETVRLDLTEDGNFTVFTTSSEIGQGLASMIATVASERLGVPEDRIEVVTNETLRFDEGNGTFSSRGAIFVGSATHDAAEQLREALDRANPGADPADPDAWRAVGPLTVLGRHASAEPTFGFGAHLAVASVDPDTLDVTVERLGVGYDCGRMIDEASTRGQIVGAAVHGLGGTLLQELTFDDDGQPQSTTFIDFQVPTVAEVPRVEVVTFELGGTVSNPLGVKGVGEAGIMGVGGSVANAVAAALDAPRAVRRLPIRPDALLPHAPELLPPPPPRARPHDVPAPATEAAPDPDPGLAAGGPPPSARSGFHSRQVMSAAAASVVVLAIARVAIRRWGR